MLYFFFAPSRERPADHILYGATFTKSYAEYLKLPWKDVYIATLDDLGIRSLRIGLNWDEIEPRDGQFDFSAFDWMMNEAQKRHVTVILAIGRKLPRWPECRVPAWASSLSADQLHGQLFAMLSTVVDHYKRYPALRYWQVENEPVFSFGDCPTPDYALWKQEITLVRSQDPDHPIMGTDSGELGFWIGVGSQVDVLGSSLYRVTWNPLFGFTHYPFPPAMYARKAHLLRPFVKHAIISELQLETWLPHKSVFDVPVAQQLQFMNAASVTDALAYARNTGFDEIYLWGVEWWYWLKEQGDPSIWNAVRSATGSTTHDVGRVQQRFVPVLVFTRSHCSQCDRERRWLDQQSAADATLQPVYYQADDPLVQPLLRSVVRKAGLKSSTLPITLVGTTIVQGFGSVSHYQLDQLIVTARNADRVFERFEDYVSSSLQ